jgi:phosphoribosylglycinamide formyltransferase-1
MMRVAVFASGAGSNFESIVTASRQPGASYEVSLLVSDKPKSGAVTRASNLGVPAFAVRPADFPSREAYEEVIVRELRERGIDFIVLAGYMRLVTSTLLDAYESRIINVHPSLLPAFPGKNAVEQALEYGVKVTGVTVHFVDGGMDTGPVIAQEAVAIEPSDTAESLYGRIREVEHRLYPSVVAACGEGRIRLDGRKVLLLDSIH